MEEFDFILEHRKGKENRLTDALSRNPIEVVINHLYNILNLKRKFSEINKDEQEKIKKFKNDNQDKKMIDHVYGNNLFGKENLIMERYIDLVYAGAYCVYKSLKENYFWKTMRKDIIDILKNCPQCLTYNKIKKN